MRTFYDKLVELCAQRGLAVSAAVTAMGYSTGNIARWKQGVLPKGKVLNRAAQFFDVPVEHFWNAPLGLLEAQKEELLQNFVALPESARLKALEEVQKLLQESRTQELL